MKKNKRFMFKTRTKYIFAVITILLFIVSFLSYGIFMASISMGHAYLNDHNVTVNITSSYDEEYLEAYDRNNAIHVKIEYSWKSNISMKVIALDDANLIQYNNNAPYSSQIEKKGTSGSLILEYSRPNIPTGKFHILIFVDPEVRLNLSNGTKVKFSEVANYGYEKADGVYLWAYDGGLGPLFLYAVNMNGGESLTLCNMSIVSTILFILFIPMTYLSIVRSKKSNRKKIHTHASEEE